MVNLKQVLLMAVTFKTMLNYFSEVEAMGEI